MLAMLVYYLCTKIDDLIQPTPCEEKANTFICWWEDDICCYGNQIRLYTHNTFWIIFPVIKFVGNWQNKQI